MALPKSLTQRTRPLAGVNLSGIHRPSSGVGFSHRAPAKVSSDWLSLCFSTYVGPDPLTLSFYGNRSLESRWIMCEENGIEPCRSLVPSGFREIKTSGLVFMNELEGAFFFRAGTLGEGVKHFVGKEISFQGALGFLLTTAFVLLPHSQGSDSLFVCFPVSK